MIDRVKPKFFSSDQDERLSAEGVMTYAKNVTIANIGEGSDSILKNAKGTTAITTSGGNSQIIHEQTVYVIGTVEDDAAGRIYVFVAGTESTDDGIYYVDTVTGEYTVVIRSARLNFRPIDFVKADIIKGTFLSSSQEETVIYFTDNYNPPRKINVDRAIAGDYSIENADTFDRMISVIKGASNLAPSVRVGSETSREVNNIGDNLFQFATQIIYKDGEESALSPYSKIVLSRPAYLNALSDQGFGVMNYVDNYVDVTHNIDFNSIPDIEKIRILCRSSNNASWFIAEEYNPFEDLVANIDGSAVTLASANSQKYRFYADTLGSLVSPTVTNKQYDNVPLKARGQAIVNNRLIYSNYTEGFGNTNCRNATIQIRYSDDSEGYEEHILPSDISGIFGTTASNTQITIDFSAASSWSSDTDAVAAGTRTSVSFDFRFEGFIESATAGQNILQANVREAFEDQNDEWYDITGTAYWDGITLSSNNTHYTANSPTVTLVSTLSQDGDVGDVLELLSDQLLYLYKEVKYDVSPWTSIDYIDGSGFSDNIPGGGDDGYMVARWQFNDYSVDGTVLTIRPYVSSVRIEGCDDSRLISVDGSWFTVTSNDQSDLLYTSDGDPTSNQDADSVSLNLSSTLKSGSSHSFGIVYYDKFGRHGFVNPIGSASVKYPSKRNPATEGYGNASARIVLTDKVQGNLVQIPSWADSWQLVCSEPNSISNSFQYTTGGAYVPVDEDGNVLMDQRRIYVSLKTLDKYRDEKGVTRDYSFTEGDKLRVVKYWNSYTESWNYPTANATLGNTGSDTTNFGTGGTYNQPIIEFDVVGVEFLSGDDEESNPLMGVSATYTTDERKKYDGQFLVLESSQINSGVEIDIGGTSYPLRYAGFDWQSVAKGQESGTTFYYDDIDETPIEATVNNWGKRTVVDIVSPRKRTSEQIYYEVGVGGKAIPTVNNTSSPNVVPNHGQFTISFTESSYYYRPVACCTPKVTSNIWNKNDPDEWEYKTLYIEDESVTDRIVSNSWNRGKAHVIYEKAKEVQRPYSVTWSDAYNVDVETLTLSSFNASQANYANYASKYGSVNYLGNYDENLLALQENKASVTPISKSVLNQAAGGDGVVSLSTLVFNEGSINYYSGDWGCANNPESVLIYDTQVFFSDASRGKIVRITREGLSPISDKGLQGLFAEKFALFNANTAAPVGKKVISGYDPDDNHYYVTIRSLTVNKTYAYDVRSGLWMSEFSFTPDMYSRMNNTMYSFSFKAGGSISYFAWSHDKANPRNHFYNTQYGSEITVISKYDPSMPKVFNSIGINGDVAWDAVVTSSTGASTGTGKMPSSSFAEQEGLFYRSIPGDTTSASSSQASGIGTVSSVDGATITFSNRLRGMHIPVGATVKYVNGSSLTDLADGGVTVSSVDYSAKTVTVSATITADLTDAEIVVLKNQTSDGDRIRGTYAEINLTTTVNSGIELYSVDVNFTNSRPNYALGQ